MTPPVRPCNSGVQWGRSTILVFCDLFGYIYSILHFTVVCLKGVNDHDEEHV